MTLTLLERQPAVYKFISTTLYPGHLATSEFDRTTSW